MDAIRRSIYADLQDFIQLSLREPLRKVVKKREKELVRRWVFSFFFIVVASLYFGLRRKVIVTRVLLDSDTFVFNTINLFV